MIACSVNELEALTRRASRGAGLTWGLAEDAGKAMRWLAVRGWPGGALIARHLERYDGVPYAEVAPKISGAEWSARSRDICPVIAGAALSDRARDLAPGRPLTLSSVAYPALLCAFLGRAARSTDTVFEVRWPGVVIQCRAGGLRVETGDTSAIETDRAENVVVECLPDDPDARSSSALADSIEMAPEDWARLKRLAARTYVPASTESRIRGAGAGTTDND
ncbi:MAG: DUF3726 domain-containing protein [Alphaproteobacteria bacterium]|nr:DUF3726 domain-containing protein [Alphaproteobacteria bacterium]